MKSSLIAKQHVLPKFFYQFSWHVFKKKCFLSSSKDIETTLHKMLSHTK